MKNILSQILLKLFVQHPTVGPDFLLLICLEVQLHNSIFPSSALFLSVVILGQSPCKSWDLCLKGMCGGVAPFRALENIACKNPHSAGMNSGQGRDTDCTGGTWCGTVAGELGVLLSPSTPEFTFGMK